MRNFIQEGNALTITAPAGGTISGQPVVVGKIFFVASETVPAGTRTVGWRKGVYQLGKTNAQAWAQGDALYWDAANSLVTNVNAGGALLPVGWAADPAANPSPLGNVLLGQSAS